MTTQSNPDVLRVSDLAALGWHNTDRQEWALDPAGVPRPLPPKDIFARERAHSVKPDQTTRRKRWWQRGNKP